MNRKKVLSMMMTAVLTFTSVVPQPALYANAEGDVIIEEVSEEDPGDETVSNDEAEAVSENATEGVSDNDAEGESVSENNTETVSDNEAVSENEVDEEIVSGNGINEKELPTGIKGMPEGYALSEREAGIKADMINHDVLIELKNAVAGVDYIEDQVYCIAETEEYAQQIADAYGIELVEYNYEVAIFSTKDFVMDVPELVEISADPDYELPPLSPDYIRGERVEEPVGQSTELAGINAESASVLGINKPGWEDTVNVFSDPDEYLYPDSPDYQWWHDVMDTYAGWGAYNGIETNDDGIIEQVVFSGNGISVAVIDSGVDKDNTELNGHVTIETAGGGAAVEGTHGTQMAEIIGADANNGTGGAGVAPGVKIIGYRNTDAAGKVSSAYTTAALRNAADNGCTIACVGGGSGFYDALEEAAVKYAHEKQVTIFAPSGDEGANNVNYPAQYDHVISVGAVQSDSKRAPFSTYGKGIVDVYAPGVDMSTLSYHKAKETSMACAAAAGACVLYMSVAGKTDPDTMEKILTERTVKCASSDAGAGIVNVVKMLEGDTTAPVLEIYGAPGNMIRVDSGKTVKATVDSSDYIKVIPMLESGKENTKQHTQVFFTVNGKKPSFKRTGVPSAFTRLSDTGYINIKPYINILDDKQQKLTIKVVCVTGIGVVSKATTLKLTVNPAKDGTVYIYGMPVGKLASGCSLQMEAWIQKGDSYSGLWKEIKNPIWSIGKGSDIADINTKTGMLKSKAGCSGEVEVICTYKEGDLTVSGKETITVAEFLPVKSFALSDTSVKIATREIASRGLSVNQTVRVISAKNANDEEIVNEDNVGYRWTSSDIYVAFAAEDEADPLGRTVRIIPRGKGTTTITCTATDGSNKSASIKVEVVGVVTGIDISGPKCIAVGGTAAFKAEALGIIDMHTGKRMIPDDASVTWSIYPFDIKKVGIHEVPGNTKLDSDAITIDEEKGTVKINKKSSYEEFYVYAKANDGSEIYKCKRIKITDKKTGEIKIGTEAAGDAYQIKKNKKDSITSLQLFTGNTVSGAADVSRIAIVARSDSGTTVSWKSSKESVVSIEPDEYGATLKAVGTGTATITCMTNDGTGKKARIKVKVIVPVSNLMLSNETLITKFNKPSNETYALLGIGNKTKTKVTVGDTYGKPAKVKVTWDYELVEAKWDEASSSYIVGALTDDVLAKAKAAKFYSGSNGRLSFRKDYAAALVAAGLSGKELAVRVSATTTDGSNITATKLFIPSKRVESIRIMDLDSGKELKTMTVDVAAKDRYEVDDKTGISLIADYLSPTTTGKNLFRFYEASVSSSDASVATAYLENSGKLRISYGSKKGTATITCKAVDGSGKKCKIKVIVK